MIRRAFLAATASGAMLISTGCAPFSPGTQSGDTGSTGDAGPTQPTLQQDCVTGWQDDSAVFHSGTEPTDGLAIQFAWQATLTNNSSTGVNVTGLITEFDDASSGQELASATSFGGGFVSPGKSLSWVMTPGDTTGLPNDSHPPEVGSDCRVVQWTTPPTG